MSMLLMAELTQFSGGGKVYNHRFAANLPQTTCHRSIFGPLKVVYSEGVKYLVDKGNCRWLLDAIASHLPKAAADKNYAAFHIWIFHEAEVRFALDCVMDTDDGSMQNPLVRQWFEITDFPFGDKKSFKLYAGATEMEGENGEDLNVMNVFLPSEY